MIEVRRAEDGIRTWAAEPGEYYHSFTGEFGGLWRRNGRPPNVAGRALGFTAQGFDLCSYYRRQPGSTIRAPPSSSRASTGRDHRRFRPGRRRRRRPRARPRRPRARHAAQPPGPGLVREPHRPDPGGERGGQRDDPRPHRHARPSWCAPTSPSSRRPAGGAVFSTGSIAWCGSLSHNGYDNNVARITGNVLRRFLDPTPFRPECGEWSARRRLRSPGSVLLLKSHSGSGV